jgi:DNA-directed RNA polymerase subunit RPC12/RpoP
MWAICISCHRHAEIKSIPKGKHLRCSACGSQVARSVRVIRHSMLNGGVTPPDEARILTYAGLLSIAQIRGYPRGWTGHKYRAIYGVWPPASTPDPANPSPELMWFVKRENIEYAKAHFPRESKKIRPSSEHTEDNGLMTQDDWDVDL